MIHLVETLRELRELKTDVDNAIEVIERLVDGGKEPPVVPEEPIKPDPPEKKKLRYFVSRGQLHECMLAIGAPASIQEIRDGLKKGFLIQVPEKTVLGLFELNPKMFTKADNGLWLAVRRVD